MATGTLAPSLYKNTLICKYIRSVQHLNHYMHGMFVVEGVQRVCWFFTRCFYVNLSNGILNIIFSCVTVSHVTLRVHTRANHELCTTAFAADNWGMYSASQTIQLKADQSRVWNASLNKQWKQRSAGSPYIIEWVTDKTNGITFTHSVWYESFLLQTTDSPTTISWLL